MFSGHLWSNLSAIWWQCGWAQEVIHLPPPSASPSNGPIHQVKYSLTALQVLPLLHQPLVNTEAQPSFWAQKPADYPATHHRTYSSCLFIDITLKKFLKGLRNSFLAVRLPQPACSLFKVLTQFTSPPFEPLATTNLRLLALKTAFLLASGQVSLQSSSVTLGISNFIRTRLHCTWIPPSCWRLLPPSVYLCCWFTPYLLSSVIRPRKEITHVRCQKGIDILPFPYQGLHNHTKAVCVTKTRPKVFQSTPSICLAGLLMLLHLLMPQLRDLPPHIQGYSTQSIASSTAFVHDVDIQTICRVAT